MNKLTWDPAKNKFVKCGNIIGTTIFRDVKPEHFMRMVQGYGIQEVAFQDMMAYGVKTIVLKETHTSQQWEADIQTWLLHSKVADYGHGKQRFLGLKFMKTHKLKEPDEQKEAVRAETIAQARLFT